MSNNQRNLSIESAFKGYFVAGCIDNGCDVIRVKEHGLTDDEAEFFTVYGTTQANLSFALKDFATKQEAESYMAKKSTLLNTVSTRGS